MANPDLGDQLSRILASLEKTTPQVLEMATRAMKFDAVTNGTTLLVLMCVCLYFARKAYHYIKSNEKDWSDDRFVWCTVAMWILLGAALVLACYIPGQVTKFANARYYAVTYLLARVKP